MPARSSGAGRRSGAVRHRGRASQFSIAAAQDPALRGARRAGLALLTSAPRALEAPAFFWPLVAYARVTLCLGLLARPARQPGRLQAARAVSDRAARLRFARGDARRRRWSRSSSPSAPSARCSASSSTASSTTTSSDDRPQGTLGHYMTYSGLLMLVICARSRASCSSAAAALGALVMPALLVVASP